MKVVLVKAIRKMFAKNSSSLFLALSANLETGLVYYNAMLI